MCMSTIIQNTVPKKCAFDYAKICTTNSKLNAETACSNAKDLLKNLRYQLVK